MGRVAGPIWILFGSVAVVLLIACANVGNLFLVRAERRQRELAVRRAIGAGRLQLFRAQITEALVVALLAGALAMVLAWVSVPLYLKFVPPDVPRIGDVAVRWGTLLFTGVASALAALLCGGLPALRASEPSLDRLRDGSRGSTARRHWARDGLVVAQTALALVLLTGSALLFRSYQKMRNVDPGYDTRDIFTFQIAPEGEQLKDAALVRPIPPRLHGAARAPAGREVGGDRGQRAAQREPRPTPGSSRPSGRARPAAACGWASPRSRATTSRPWGSGCSRAGRSPRRTSSPTSGT